MQKVEILIFFEVTRCNEEGLKKWGSFGVKKGNGEELKSWVTIR